MLRRLLFPTALCFALLGRAELTACAAEPEPTPEARAHFKRGLELLKSQNNEEALRELKAAYELTPKWTALVSIGIASERLERDGEAIDAYREYLDRGGAALDERQRARVQSTLERLRGDLATVTLERPGTLWVVDTRAGTDGSVVNHYGPYEGRAELRVRAGQHELQLERAGASPPSPWTVALVPGDVATHAFVDEPEVAPGLAMDFEAAAVEPVAAAEIEEPRSQTPAYVLWGLGALAAGGTTVMYLESRHMQNRADDAFATTCPNGVDRSDVRCANTMADDASAANWRTASLLTGAGAVGALVAGTVLYSLDLRGTRNTSGEAAGFDEPALRVWVSSTSAGLSGTF